MTVPLTKYEAAIIEAVSNAHKADPSMDIDIRTRRIATNADGITEYVDIDARVVQNQLRLSIRDSPNSQNSGPRVTITDVTDAEIGYFSGLKIVSSAPAATVEFAVEKESEDEALAMAKAEDIVHTDEKPKGKKHRNPDIGWKPEE